MLGLTVLRIVSSTHCTISTFNENIQKLQDYVADKASLCSGKSQRSTDIDTVSVPSAQKRVIPLVQRISKINSPQHRNISVDGSSNAVEQYEQDADSCSITKTKLSDKLNDKIPMPSSSDVTTSTAIDGSESSMDGAIGNTSAKSLNTKNFSKAAILRNLFFSQYMDGGSNSKS